jgi:pyruvate kinase
VEAVSHAACTLAAEIGAAAILVPADDGTEPIQIAAHRPAQPVVALTPDRRVAVRLAVGWGITPVFYSPERGADDVFHGVERAIAAGLLASGDRYVLVRTPSPAHRGGIEVAYA